MVGSSTQAASEHGCTAPIPDEFCDQSDSLLQHLASSDDVEFVTATAEHVTEEKDEEGEETEDKTIYDDELEKKELTMNNPLFGAVFRDDVAQVESMLDAGDLSLDQEIPIPAELLALGISPTLLQMVASHGAQNTVTLLIERKASLDLQNRDGQTALLFAVQRCNSSVTCCLLEAGANEIGRAHV